MATIPFASGLPSPRGAQEFHAHGQSLLVRTRHPVEFVDLTERVAACLRRSGVLHGLVSVQTRHTTTAIVVNENEPLLLEDLRDRIEAWAPRDATYRHDDLSRRPGVPPDEPRNGPAHAGAVLLGASETLAVAGGRLALGRWQRVFLVELDGGRERNVEVTVLGMRPRLTRPGSRPRPARSGGTRRRRT